MSLLMIPRGVFNDVKVSLGFPFEQCCSEGRDRRVGLTLNFNFIPTDSAFYYFL